MKASTKRVNRLIKGGKEYRNVQPLITRDSRGNIINVKHTLVAKVLRYSPEARNLQGKELMQYCADYHARQRAVSRRTQGLVSLDQAFAVAGM